MSTTEVFVDVPGFCPACGGESLFTAAGGHITCRRMECTRPTAADELLTDRETEHVIEFTDQGFTVRHPLIERLDDALMDCMVHHEHAARRGPPVVPGRYRVRRPNAATPHYTYEELS